MTELTPEMHKAMQEAMARARRYLIANFPAEGEHLFCTMLASGFTDMLSNGTPAGQAALADVTNERLAGKSWRFIQAN